ncbi:MAG: tRNA (guanosine(37)-N1)-methyltransferase TrmD [Clostridia bacterium]|nr:tRNA (guanosine(37)-N1)-methyltransferase TrmD [Clostridia bacterium]
MKFDILTLFPEMINGFLSESILGRAVKNGVIDIKCTNIRDFANDKHNRVDDYPFGGGLGMVMRPQPVFDTYNYVTKDCKNKPYTVYMSPKGKVFNQEVAKNMATKDHIVIICGHYEGVDQRVIDEICDEEISIGDYVLTGGEIAACVVCDSVARLVPGVLSENSSFELESHYNGLLEQPQYTRPREFNGINVPEVLLSGHSKNISEWEHEKSVEITMKMRPDLCEKNGICVIKKPSPKTDAKILVLGLGDADVLKKIQTVKMHCIKNGLKNIDFKYKADIDTVNFDDYDGLFAVACSEYQDFEINTHIPKMMCGYQSDTLKIAEVFSFTQKNGFEVTENVFLSASEIVQEIYDFSVACTFKNAENKNSKSLIKHISGENSNKLSIKSGIPHDLYENNRGKFQGFEKQDLMFVQTDFDAKITDVTLAATKDSKVFLAQGTLFKVKSKAYGNTYVLAAKGLGKFYRYAILENDISEFDVVTGFFAKRAFKVAKLLDNEVICCSEKTFYKEENLFK